MKQTKKIIISSLMTLFGLATSGKCFEFNNIAISLHGPNLEIVQARFSEDSQKVILLAKDNTISTWNALTGDYITALVEQPNAAALSPDGTRAAVALKDGEIKFLNTNNGSYEGCIPDAGYGITSLSYSPDGKSLLATFVGGSLKVWGAKRGLRIKQPYSISRASFSSSGNIIADLDGGGTRHLDGFTGNELQDLSGTPKYPLSGSISPDGQKMVIINDDNTASLLLLPPIEFTNPPKGSDKASSFIRNYRDELQQFLKLNSTRKYEDFITFLAHKAKIQPTYAKHLERMRFKHLSSHSKNYLSGLLTDMPHAFSW